MTGRRPRSNGGLGKRVEMVRAFNRFYTRQIGLLQEVLLDSEFSLTEVRVLYELDARGQAIATDLGRDLGLDPGYLSRMLRRFEEGELILRRPAAGNARKSVIELTARGRAAFEELDARSHDQIAELLGRLELPEQRELVRAMSTVQRLLANEGPAAGAYVIRPPEPGDLGWIVHRHGVLYAREHGWDERFEGLVAAVVGDFVREMDPARDRCWVADSEGEIVGSIFLAHQDARVAQLRLLYVEPAARGRGIAKRLIEECLRFAVRVRYERVTLWTNDVLVTARGLYERTGFRMVASEPHNRFGPDIMGQTWELNLADADLG